MKYLITILFLATCSVAQAQTAVLTTDPNLPIPSGAADMDIYSTTEMPGQEGKRFEGLTLRLFNPKTRWSL